MKSLLLAAVAVVAIASAAPLAADQPIPDQAQLAQAGPMGPHMAQGGDGHRGHWRMHGHHMGQGRMMQGSPREWCAERIARQAGRMGYLESRLGLTAEQKPLWDRYQAAVRDGREKERQLCANAPERLDTTTALERDARMQKFLSTRLATMQATRPALEALYQALNTEQRTVLDRPRFGRTF